jgi:hypothetical protein
MSLALNDCTRQALVAALSEAIAAWWADHKGAWENEPRLVLPFRPLIVGGDDVLLLAHPEQALRLISVLCRKFCQLSQERHQKVPGGLWLGTGGSLTMSAGLVFAPISFPLATLIAYAENLLSGAKAVGRGRAAGQSDQPSPSMLDWEVITEGAIDNPTARRRRELQFKDNDDQGREVVLTARPWSLDKLEHRRQELNGDLERLPASIRHDLMTGLRQPAWARERWLIRMKKNWPNVYDHLSLKPGTKPTPQSWWSMEDGKLRTDVVDLLLLKEQERRANSRLVAAGSSRSPDKDPHP